MSKQPYSVHFLEKKTTLFQTSLLINYLCYYLFRKSNINVTKICFIQTVIFMKNKADTKKLTSNKISKLVGYNKKA